MITAIPDLERDDDHVYRYKGEIVVGVTEALQPLRNFEGIPESTLERKSAIGVAVHAATSIVDAGLELDPDSIDPAIAGYLEAHASFREAARPRTILNEAFVFNGRHRYAGQLDRVYAIGGIAWWVDIKCTSKISASARLQIAAYKNAAALAATTADRVGVLWLQGDGSWKLVPMDRDSRGRVVGANDFTVFLSAVNLHYWKAANRE